MLAGIFFHLVSVCVRVCACVCLGVCVCVRHHSKMWSRRHLQWELPLRPFWLLCQVLILSQLCKVQSWTVWTWDHNEGGLKILRAALKQDCHLNKLHEVPLSTCNKMLPHSIHFPALALLGLVWPVPCSGEYRWVDPWVLVLMASSLSVAKVTASRSADSSRTVPVMYGVALGPPRPLLQGNDKAGKRREKQIQIQIQIQVCFLQIFQGFPSSEWQTCACFSYKTTWLIWLPVQFTAPNHLMCAFVISWVHLHGIPDHPRGHQRPRPQRNQAGQGCHAVWHKVSLFYRSRSDADTSYWTRAHILCTIWTISIPNNKQESPYFGCILLSTRKMFTVNCEQWHYVY